LLHINNKIFPLPIRHYITLLYICVTPTYNISFQQNFTSTKHCLLPIKLPNFSWICQSKQELRQLLWGHPKSLNFRSDVIQKRLKLKCFGVILPKPL